MTKLPKNYKPTQKEKFMNAKMKEYFRQKLVNWKNDLLKESSQTLSNLQIDTLEKLYKKYEKAIEFYEEIKIK